MIITKSQIKSYLNINSTEYDNQIDSLIDPVLYDLFDFTHNYFHNNTVRLRSNNYTFSTTGTVSVSGTNFSTYHFQSGDEIHIQDSARNDGFYTAATVSSATITISTTQTFKSESLETDTVITNIRA
jgi:hypothetical protein